MICVPFAAVIPKCQKCRMMPKDCKCKETKMTKVDVNNIPEYMKECITENHSECGMFIDKKTGEIHMMEEFRKYILDTKAKVNWDKFKENYIMINWDF